MRWTPEGDIANHDMVSITSWSKIQETYDLQELFDRYGFDLKKAPKRYANATAGKSYSEVPILVWISDIIHEEKLSGQFAHVVCQVGQSVNFKTKLSPLISSVDIRPDTCLKREVGGFGLAIFIRQWASSPTGKHQVRMQSQLTGTRPPGHYR